MGLGACQDPSALLAPPEPPPAPLTITPLAAVDPLPETDTPPPSLLPPPLEPPLEDGPSLDELIDMTHRALARDRENTRRQAPPPEKPAGPFLYRWVDDQGYVFVVNNEDDIPPAFRDRAQKLAARTPAPPKPKSYTYRMQSEAQDPAPAPRTRTRTRTKERSHDDWAQKLAKLRAEQTRTREQLAAMEGSPPDCSLALVPELRGSYDPNCEVRWRAHLKRLKATDRHLTKEIETLREAARRAGVPPGYMR